MKFLKFLLMLALVLVPASSAYAQSPVKVKVGDSEYNVISMSRGRMLRIDDLSGHMIGMASVSGSNISVLAPQQGPGFDIVKAAAAQFVRGTNGTTPEATAHDELAARRTALEAKMAKLDDVTSPADRVVKEFKADGVVVYDPDLKTDVTVKNDGTEATATRESIGPMGKVKITYIARFEGGDQPDSAAKKTGKLLKGAGSALFTSLNPHVVSGTRMDSETWRVDSIDGDGKKGMLYEAGDLRTGAMIERDPTKSLGQSFLRSIKGDIAAVTAEVEKRKAAGTTVPFSTDGDRSKRALAALDKYVPN